MSVESELFRIRTLLMMIWIVVMISFGVKVGSIFADIMMHINK